MRWKRRWAKSARRRRCNGLEDDGRIRNGHRLGGSCGTENEDQNLLRLSDDLRRSAEHAVLPGLYGLSRHAAGAQSAGGALRGAGGAGDGLHDCALLQAGQKELLLSRPAQGVSDQPALSADLPKRPCRYRDGGGQKGCRHPRNPHGGGCGQAGARPVAG